MSLAQQYSEDIFDQPKKLSKEEIEKIFSKYTNHFSEFLRGAKWEDIEKIEKEKKGERDKKDCNWDSSWIKN